MSETSDEGQCRREDDEEESMDHETSQSQFSEFQSQYNIWSSQSQDTNDLFEVVSQSQQTVKTEDDITLSQTLSSQDVPKEHMSEPPSQTSSSDEDYYPGRCFFC